MKQPAIILIGNSIFQLEENHSSQSRHQNGIQHNILPDPPLSPKPPKSQDVLNSTGQNIATISNIDIDIQPQEHRDHRRKAKPPRAAPSAAKRPEREEQQKEDTAAPQPHHRKQISGVLIGKEEPSPKHVERLERVKDSKAVNADMSVEEDTMKLLHQAAMGDITHKPDTTGAKEDQKTEAEHHAGDRAVC